LFDTSRVDLFIITVMIAIPAGEAKNRFGVSMDTAQREATRAAVGAIVKIPKISRKCDELAEGLRSFPTAHPIAYYVEKGDGI
jgi:hypothetical protein